MGRGSFGFLASFGAPIQFWGVSWAALVAMARARGTGVSITALSPLATRVILHQLGKRHDPLAEKIFDHLPMSSPTGLSMYMRPTRLASELSGYEPKNFRYPLAGEESNAQSMLAARTAFIDQVVDAHRGRCSQLVLLGAGFDTRAFTHGEGFTVFEVDAPKTQGVKREVLAKIKADHPGAIVEVDFNRTSWLEALQKHGFDRAEPTVVIWEGVSYYLPQKSVQSVLREVSTLAAGSVVAFDYFGRNVTEAPWAKVGMGAIGEPFLFGLSTRSPAEVTAKHFVEAQGLTLCEHHCIGPDRLLFPALGGFVLAGVRQHDA